MVGNIWQNGWEMECDAFWEEGKLKNSIRYKFSGLAWSSYVSDSTTYLRLVVVDLVVGSGVVVVVVGRVVVVVVVVSTELLSLVVGFSGVLVGLGVGFTE